MRSNRTNWRFCSLHQKPRFLAVISEGVPSILIELKMMATFDTLVNDGRTLRNYGTFVRADVNKMRSHTSLGTRCYIIFLVEHVTSIVAKDFGGIVKYHRKINESLRTRTADGLKAESEILIEREFGKYDLRASSCIPGGEFHGIGAELLY